MVVAGCANRDRLGTSLPCQTPPPFSDSGELTLPDRWWKSFNDASLDLQINQALDGNFNLAAAYQRLRAARALTRIEAANLWPFLNGVADYGSIFVPGEDGTILNWGLEAGYQVDLWGQIESRVEAEQFRADATAADYHAVALTLSAEIARTWFSLIEAHAQLRLLDEQIETNRTGLKLQESRFALGLIRSADVLRQRQLLESTLEQYVVVQARIEVLEHQLAVLLGQMPQTASYDPGFTLPELPPLPDTGLPAELLNRRPDVRRVYLALQAADSDLAAAISARYPRLNLSGSILNLAESPGTLFENWFASIGSQLIAPLLTGGRLRAEVDRASAVTCQLFHEYGETMLAAFREVEDSLARERFQLERIYHLEEQVKLAGQSSEQLREQYLIGDVEYLDVLSAITGQQRLQRELLSAQLELVLIRVNLYLALAGDFDTCPQYLQILEEALDDPEGSMDSLESPDSQAPDRQESDSSEAEAVEEGQPEFDTDE